MKRALFALATLAVASPALAQDAETTSSAEQPKLRKRYDPGFGVGAVTDVRAYEGLNGAAIAAGFDVNYAFDLVGLRAEFLQSLAIVGERKPTFAKLDLDYAMATFGGFSALGTVGLDLVLHGPDRQSAGEDQNLWGPELGLGARYRLFPALDVFARGTAGFWKATSGPNRMFFEPGFAGGIEVHPFASED